MRKYLLFIFFSLFLLHQSKSQFISNEVIGSAGDYNVADKNICSLAWTVGEPIVETAFSLDYVLTQGFHQPSGLLRAGKKDIIFKGDNITVYPNPSINDITVDIVNILDTKITYTLTDILGQVLLSDDQNVIKNSSLKIVLDLTKISPGIYFINIYSNNNNDIRTIKFIKLSR